MQDPTKTIADSVRVLMATFAKSLNKITKGKLKPVHITLLSFIGHLPAAWALFVGRPVLAAVLITVFGLMDSLDGALAREQGSASRLGMFFDAVTDRLKEIILYSTLVVYTQSLTPTVNAWAVVALAGTSIMVSYVKAKGEMAFSGTNVDVQKLNRTFDDGFARYEIRMVLLVVGLVSGALGPIINFIVALNLVTIAMRFSAISQELTKLEKPAEAGSVPGAEHSPLKHSRKAKKHA